MLRDFRLSPSGGVEEYAFADMEGKSKMLSLRRRGKNGAGGIRTPDLIDANDALSQLSHSPKKRLDVSRQGGQLPYPPRLYTLLPPKSREEQGERIGTVGLL
jgi:hypothetical protein